jgi:hypothetical protein
MGMPRSYRALVHTGRGVRGSIADRVDTCVGLPRLTPLEQTAPWVLGAFDLRGDLVPVIGLGVLHGEPIPRAAATDLVLIVLAGGFPLALHSARPVRIEPMPPSDALSNPGLAQAGQQSAGALDCIELSRLPLTARDSAGHTDAERRLAQFERQLSAQALRQLEQRARRYGDFAGPSPALPLTPTPAQQR